MLKKSLWLKMAAETDGNLPASQAPTELQLSISSKRVAKASKTFAALTEALRSFFPPGCGLPPEM